MGARPDHGRQIAAARAILRMNAADLAAACGLHKQGVLYNENNGRLAPDAPGPEKIAKALDRMGVSFETRADGFAVVFTRSVAGNRNLPDGHSS